MGTATWLKGVKWLGVALVAGVPATASAHTFVVSPQPRDIAEPDLDLRAHKAGPCGGVPRTGKPTQYTVGQTITVKWMETISHQGCFQIGFSPANDQNFVLLKQINDPAGGAGMVYTDTVTLPAGVSCPACTLVVRQLMQGTTCPANADPAASLMGTYYSCADICVGATCTDAPAPDAGGPVDAGADSSTKPGTDGGPTTVPTDGGGKLADASDGPGPSSSGDLHSGDGGGCNVAFGATSGVSFAVTAGLLGLALARRRRRRG